MEPSKLSYRCKTLFFIMLKGIELIDTIKQDETADEKGLARKCGYATVQKNGSEKILLTSFYEAILIAKGITD